jgi:hypothetical protein
LARCAVDCDCDCPVDCCWASLSGSYRPCDIASSHP